MAIIAFAGQKGGSGKSTAAIAFAAECIERGLSVLLVDADPQGMARTWGEVANQAGHQTPTVVVMGPDLHRPGQLPTLAKRYEVAVIDCPPASCGSSAGGVDGRRLGGSPLGSLGS